MNDDNINYIESPIEELFDIEKGTTMSKVQNVEVDIIDEESEDEKISAELDTIYGYAIDAYESQQNQLQIIDPKYAARNAEVAAQYLKIALDATSQRSSNHINKKKLEIQNAKNLNNNQSTDGLIVADRNELLKMINGKSDE